MIMERDTRTARLGIVVAVSLALGTLVAGVLAFDLWTALAAR